MIIFLCGSIASLANVTVVLGDFRHLRRLLFCEEKWIVTHHEPVDFLFSRIRFLAERDATALVHSCLLFTDNIWLAAAIASICIYRFHFKDYSRFVSFLEII